MPLDPSLSIKALAALAAVVLLAAAVLRALRAATGAGKPGGLSPFGRATIAIVRREG